MQGIKEIFSAQQQHKYLLRKTDARARIAKLKKLKAAIRDLEPLVYAALRQDLRKNAFEAAVTEVLFIYGELDHAISHLKAWMRPRRAKKALSNFFARNRIYYEPKGTCLIMAPWNYPFQLVMSPLISAIAAGNCAMVKPSELSPATSSVLEKLISSTFAAEEIACIPGGADVATALLELPFDHIFFTGSTAIGKVVMAAAAKNLTSVTLELGGKSPVVIDGTSDIAVVAEKVAWGKLVNAGQTCIAPDYVLVQEKYEQAFIGAYKIAVKSLFFKGGTVDKNVYGKIINDRHRDRLNALIGEAVDSGAMLAMGSNGELPAVLTNVPPQSKVMKEEIFGPILPVIPYRELTDAIAHINNEPKPLALYIFSNKKDNINRVLKETSSGGTCVNDVLVHIGNPYLPFGGVNSSGMGSCHGEFGFKTFSHERAVVFQSGPNTTKMIYPPYDKKNWVLKLLKKIM